MSLHVLSQAVFDFIFSSTFEFIVQLANKIFEKICPMKYNNSQINNLLQIT